MYCTSSFILILRENLTMVPVGTLPSAKQLFTLQVVQCLLCFNQGHIAGHLTTAVTGYKQQLLQDPRNAIVALANDLLWAVLRKLAAPRDKQKLDL